MPSNPSPSARADQLLDFTYRKVSRRLMPPLLKIGILSAIPYVGAGIGMILVGRSTDRHDEHRWHMAIPGLLASIGLIVASTGSSHVAVAFSALVLATFGILTVASIFWSLTSKYLNGLGAAAGIAFINSFGCLAGFASPYAVGWIKDTTGSTRLGMYAVALALALGAFLVLFAAKAKQAAVCVAGSS
jgi:MFS family permease